MTDFTPALKKQLRQNGFTFWRSGRGDHEIWRNAETGLRIVVDNAIKSRHTANGILKQAKLPKAF